VGVAAADCQHGSPSVQRAAIGVERNERRRTGVDDLLRDLADYDRAFGVDLNAEDRGGEVA
jgi:hypothetical protein